MGGGAGLVLSYNDWKYSCLIGNIEGQYINFHLRLFSDVQKLETKDFHTGGLNYEEIERYG